MSLDGAWWVRVRGSNSTRCLWYPGILIPLESLLESLTSYIRSSELLILQKTKGRSVYLFFTFIPGQAFSSLSFWTSHLLRWHLARPFVTSSHVVNTWSPDDQPQLSSSLYLSDLCTYIIYFNVSLNPTFLDRYNHFFHTVPGRFFSPLIYSIII